MDPELIKLLAMTTGLVALFSFFILIIIGLEVLSSNAVKMFRRDLRIYGYKLVFPEKLRIGVGRITIVDFFKWRFYEPRWLREVYSDVLIDEFRDFEADSIDLNELCNSHFYLVKFEGFTKPYEHTQLLYVSAPGFIVKDPYTYKNIVGICIDPSKAESRRITIGRSVGDGFAEASIDVSGSDFAAELKVFGDVKSARLDLRQTIRVSDAVKAWGVLSFYEVCIPILKAGKRRREVVKKIDVFRDRVILLAFKGDGVTALRDFSKLPKGIVAGCIGEDAKLRLEIRTLKAGKVVVESTTMQRI
jgi:hypothetical protein